MNKALSLILTLVMCLFLFACGSDKPGSQPETKEPYIPSGSHISDHPFLEVLYGEWRMGLGIHAKPASLFFEENGVCLVEVEYSSDSEGTHQSEYIWWVEEDKCTDSLLRIRISNDTRDVYILEVFVEDGKEYSARLTEIYESGMPDMWYLAYKEKENAAFHTVLGEWVLMVPDDTVPGSVEFFEDYTCLINGTRYSWELIYSGGDSFTAKVLNVGDRGTYDFLFLPKEETGAYYTYIYNVNMSIYARPADWEIIDITPENLFDYYELVDNEFYFIRDAFGEYTDYSFTQTLELKEEYAGRDFQYGKGRTRIVMEIAYSCYNRPVKLDLENMSGEFVGESVLDYTGTRTYEFYSAGTDIWSCISGINGSMLYYDDIEILRTTGQLWLRKQS